jgi:hypothetical protein
MILIGKTADSQARSANLRQNFPADIYQNESGQFVNLPAG